MSPPLEVAAMTHPGKVRLENEDSIAADARLGLAVLADGMGGHNAGEVASRMAVELAQAELAPRLRAERPLAPPRAEAMISDYLVRANADLMAAAHANSEFRGMGTTLVVAVWHEAGVSFGHVGDSRLYRLRAGALRRLTRDHSYVQEQVDRGELTPEEARHAPNRNVLTRAVGIDTELEPDVRTCAVEAGDLYLLCSDGLTDMLADDGIASILAAERSLRTAAARLVDEANAQGGLDNISVVLARVAARAAERTA